MKKLNFIFSGQLQQDENCHFCGRECPEGDIFYRPVFKRGLAPDALSEIPHENWLDCSQCVIMRRITHLPRVSQSHTATLCVFIHTSRKNCCTFAKGVVECEL